MYNGNTYKRFCTIMIALGLVFSIGQLAYAQAPDFNSECNALTLSQKILRKAKRELKKNPTRENRENLAKCWGNYAIDCDNLAEALHTSEFEILTRFVSMHRANAARARAKQASIIADIDETIKNRENAERLWNEAADSFDIETVKLSELIYKKRKAMPVKVREKARLEREKLDAIVCEQIVYFLISEGYKNSTEFESTPAVEHISKRPPLL